MNDFLINKLISHLDVDERIKFMYKCYNLLLNDEIFTKEKYRINNIELNLNLLVSICKYYANNSNKNYPEIEERIKKINLKKLYFLVLKNLTEEEKIESKIMISNLYKEYYEICEKCNWNEEDLKKSRKNAKILDNVYNSKFTFNEIVILNETRIEQIIEYGSFYSKEIIGKNRNKKIREIMNNNNYKLINFILKENDNYKILDFLHVNYHKICENTFEELINNFIINYSLVENINDTETLKQIEKTIYTKLENIENMFYEEVNSKKTRKKEIIVNKNRNEQNEKFENKAKKYVELYINGEYRNIKHFCREMHIAITIFKEYLKTIKETNIELYNNAAEKMKMESNIRKISVNKNLKKIVEYIQNGVELEDGTIKKFDILDCFELTGISIINMRNSLNKSELSHDDLKIIRDFLNQYRNSKKIMKFSIYNERDILMIDNKPYEVSNNEKEQVINYLESNGIPLLNTTYSLALKKLLNGTLNIKSKIKKLEN